MVAVLLVRAVGWSDPSCGTRNSQRSLSLGEFRPLRLFALPVSATGGSRAQSPNEARPTARLRMGENGAKRHSRGAAEKGGGRYGYEPPRCATSRYALLNEPIYYSMGFSVCQCFFVEIVPPVAISH